VLPQPGVHFTDPVFLECEVPVVIEQPGFDPRDVPTGSSSRVVSLDLQMAAEPTRSLRKSSQVTRPTARVRGQVRADSDRASCFAGEPHRHDEPMIATGFELPTEQLGHRVHSRSGHFGYQTRGQAKREFDQPGRDLSAVDRLEADPGEDGNERHLGHLFAHDQERVVELGGA